MYLQPWQVFALGCVIGTLISFILLSTIILRIVGKAGVRQMQIQQPQRDPGVDLISKLCFILLARKLIDEVDNDFMLDRIDFNSWKNHIDELIYNKEDVDCGDNRDQQRDTQEDNNM